MSEGEVQVNENTSEVAEPIEVSGGSSVVSFDDLEKVQDIKPVEKKVETKDALQKQEVKKEEKVETKPKAEKAEKDPKATEVDKKDTAAKIIKVKQGDEEIALNSDTLIDVKVNGETIQVPIADLLGEFSGKTDWTRKYSEFGREKQAFEKDRTSINDTVQTFYKLATDKKDPKSAIDFLGKVAGIDTGAFWKEFQSQLEPALEARFKMTPEERKAADMEAELQDYKRREAQAKESEKLSKTRQEYLGRISKVQADLKMSEEDFVKAYQELKASGTVPVDKLEPEHVAEFVKNRETYGAMEKLVKEVNPGLEDVGPAIKELAEVWKMNPTATVDDLKDIALALYGSEAAKNLSRKIKKSQPKQTARPTSQGGKEAWSFDDL